MNNNSNGKDKTLGDALRSQGISKILRGYRIDDGAASFDDTGHCQCPRKSQKAFGDLVVVSGMYRLY